MCTFVYMYVLVHVSVHIYIYKTNKKHQGHHQLVHSHNQQKK